MPCEESRQKKKETQRIKHKATEYNEMESKLGVMKWIGLK
jgi:hypothetical protein